MSQIVIGYTVNSTSNTEYNRLIQQGNCQEVIIADHQSDYCDQFEQFLLTHREQSLVVLNYQSMGLQLTQLLPILQLIKDYQIMFDIIENPLGSSSSYLDVLYDLAKKEKEVISWRTRIGLEKAQINGIVVGRPTIDKQTIKRIQKLYFTQRKTLREISVECGISLGTVHKYAKQFDEV